MYEERLRELHVRRLAEELRSMDALSMRWAAGWLIIICR